MTYSIGFRAPSRSELIAHWCDDVLGRLQDDDRYSDPDLRAQPNPGEISAAALARLHVMITETLSDRDAFARWFGEYTSARKYPDVDWQPDEPITIADLRANLANGAALSRNPAMRFSFVRQGGEAVLLFIDGESIECSGETAAFAQQLCAQDHIIVAPDQIGSDPTINLIAALFKQGSIAFEPDEHDL